MLILSQLVWVEHRFPTRSQVVLMLMLLVHGATLNGKNKESYDLMQCLPKHAW